MKEYRKPSIELIDLTTLGRLMVGGLEGASAGGGQGGSNQNVDEGNSLAPQRRVFF